MKKGIKANCAAPTDIRLREERGSERGGQEGVGREIGNGEGAGGCFVGTCIINPQLFLV